ncbi:recombinase zinc beta ribbon domain-containing protein [Rhizobium sp. VS19-DR104.2]|uniref:zinc ribbon domain-containing protein n=1 Tax=unclassified Rhizobium TaxID=2613769 RepID=UPI001CC62862|nr:MULTISPECIES: zinc ribbon domain-containing protein [unclassified Rhizobium]MBZ5762401.1 recombinase zinc beta ribbon domain-containing protein [Rhizobium sp. VS19-DR96]MBZ5768448.1 recombinase zinc beta ribbon domain-containing protein [Rhizobium sp. VS19-DR129.2]MBZ5776102.1 recombinase zinc beta ribbon domain-containing protein [Rhizobium sp. VS19-DRK62.2]MBZ5786207.1 recombinase zinc beta ribbon domain-containing protein [Rhizobium sp. VS19-DR121]MBZ5804479.1 recombinase zinc beta ribbo
MRVLHNPRYAGAYAYGRRRYRRTIDGKKLVRKQGSDDWTACIPDAHPGYISWEQHQENLRILKSNICHKWNAAVASPPREGPALLQGRAVCGQCGRHFHMRYAARRGRQEAWYVCDRARTNRGEPLCQALAAPPVDEAIGIFYAFDLLYLDGHNLTGVSASLFHVNARVVNHRVHSSDLIHLVCD